MLLAIATICLATFRNPHPHAIRDEADAISTAYGDWAATVDVPHNDDENELGLWKKTYSAHKDGNTWVLWPHPGGARYSGQGTHIRIDGKTGCVISEISID